uniref:Penicillin-binding protein (D-alanyl-D-alanine carboxypeptidase) n=1 Tax=mine drainage metagenome TaxID=410659 RepID=E6QKT0_9ZZZZ
MTTASAGAEAEPGLDRVPGSRTVRVWGTIPATGYIAPMAIEDPAEYAARSLRMVLAERGITVTGQARARHRLSTVTTDYAIEQAEPVTLHPVAITTFAAPLAGRRVLAEHVSPPVAEDIVVTNKVSQNLHAELTLRLLGRLLGTDGSYAQGVRVVRQFLISAGVPAEDFFFHDGSGMSMSDLISPRAYTTLLSYAARQSWGSEWRASLPVGGVDGSLDERYKGTPLDGKIFAKTGSLSEVSALSGYLVSTSGQTIVFSILVNDHLPGETHAHAATKAMDRICLAIAAAE